MDFPKFKKLLFSRLLYTVLAAATTVLAVYSYFKSAWVKEKLADDCTKLFTEENACPSLSQEIFFLSVVVFGLCLSALFLLVSSVVSVGVRTRIIIPFDLGFHVIAGALYLVGSASYIVSTEKIHKLFPDDISPDGSSLQLCRTEKWIASALGVVLGFQSFLNAKLITDLPKTL